MKQLWYINIYTHVPSYHVDQHQNHKGPSWSWSYGSWIYNYLYSISAYTITTKVVSSNPANGEVYSIHYCQWLTAGWWFSPGTLVSSTNKTDRHNITEILLKVAFNTIKPKPNCKSIQKSYYINIYISVSLIGNDIQIIKH
jgi:hypothetical protein